MRKQCLFRGEGFVLVSMRDWESPGFIVTNKDDGILVSDHNTAYSYVLSADDATQYVFGSSCIENGQLKQPNSVSTNDGNILIGDMGKEYIQVIKHDGTFVSIIEGSESPLKRPGGLAVIKDGHVYVTNWMNECVNKYTYRDMCRKRLVKYT